MGDEICLALPVCRDTVAIPRKRSRGGGESVTGVSTRIRIQTVMLQLVKLGRIDQNPRG